MNVTSGFLARRLPGPTLMAACLLWGGCRNVEPVFSEVSHPALSQHSSAAAETRVMEVGDMVPFHYLAIPNAAPLYTASINEDGAITLPLIGSVAAAGKTPRELGEELRRRHPQCFQRLTPRPSHDLVLHVSGEVRREGPLTCIGGLTLTKVVQSVGGFTEFANRKKVTLIRADGRREMVNFNNLIKDPLLDPPVYPGDRIEVPRKSGFRF